MSGLLRRIKRSRPADAGEPLQEGQAAAPEGAPTPAEAPVFGPARAPGQPAGDSAFGAAPGGQSAFGPAPAPGGQSAFGPAPAPDQPAAPGPAAGKPPQPAPVLLADPSVPAGIDPSEAPLRPPAGRRGRLRRRLRYLRRARELMLRDLGGLLYEVHRTGGGNVEAHASVLGAKLQRIAGLDAEAHALEAALGAPRADAVVFQPGIGGTCATCGELYGSDARFCANCGAAIGAAPVTPAAPGAEAPTSELAEAPAAEKPTRGFWRRRKQARATGAGDATAATTAETASGDATGPATSDDPAVAQSPAMAVGDRATASDETVADEPAAARDEPATDETVADEPAAARDESAGDTAARDESTGDAAARDESAGDDAARDNSTGAPGGDAGEEPGNPFSGLGNGRAEDHTPPDLSSGDPLVSRRRS